MAVFIYSLWHGM